MRKKSWGRLGAAIGVVTLLAGGLVGVAAPAQAEHPAGTEKCWEIGYPEGTDAPRPNDAFGQEKCSKEKLTFVAWHYSEGTDYIYWEAWGTRVQDETPSVDKDETAPGVGIFCDPFRGNKSYCKTNTSIENLTGDEKVKVEGDVCDAAVANLPSGYEKIDQKSAITNSFIECKVTAQPIGSTLPIETDDCDPDSEILVDDKCEILNPSEDCPEGQIAVVDKGCVTPDSSGAGEPVQKVPPPPPCWDSAINNCPVGGALRFAAPRYAMVGVPVTMYAYASWRPDANAPSQPTNGTAVIRVDGEDYAGVEFKDGVAEWRFIPETEGMKEFTASGVLFSGLSGANAYIDTVPARTYVLEYDPAVYATALKNKRVEVGDTYVITDPNQTRSYAEDRYEWSVSSKSEDVCAVYETKKGAVKAKFTDSGKCTVIWLDKESEESGKYTFIAEK
ncbi:MAG: hypothetical protein GKR85_10285 [Candidatus Nanopelagicales bacterium]|nr:hypothetical protein [Candidatus Nanopelagicales bacterium]